MNLCFCQKTFQYACALLLAMSMVGAEFLALAHQVTAHHVYCFAHGHMVDADQAEAQAADGSAGDVPDQTILIPGSRQGAHAHVHCDKFVFLQSGEFTFGSPVLAAGTALGEVCQPLSEARRPPSIALLFLAPKNSPPIIG